MFITRTLLVLAVGAAVLMMGGVNAIANNHLNLKGPPRHACNGLACGQGTTLPDCRGGYRKSNGTVI